MPDIVKRFIRDTGWALSSLIVAAAVQLILRIFMARYYGARDLGLYTLAFSAYSFGLVFSGFGIDMGLIKYIAERQKNTGEISLLMTTGTAISLFTGCAMGIILFIIAPYISDYFFKMPQLTALLRIVSIAFPFIAIEKAALGFLNGVRRMALFAFINVIQNILVIILTFVFALRGLDIQYAVIGLILPLVLMSLVSLIYVRKYVLKLKLSECAPVARMLLVFGFYVVLANSMVMILTYTDSVLLGHYMTDVDVGYYAVAVILIQIVTLPPSAVQRITGPMIADFWGRKEINNIEILINRCMKYAAFYAILIAFLVGFLSSDFIKLFFGGDFVAAAISFQILLGGAVFSAVSTSVGSALSSTAYVQTIFKLTGLTVILNIVLNILLIPHLGIAGAATATSISTAGSAIILLYFTQRLIKIKIDWVWFMKLFGISALIAVGAYGVGRVFNHYICMIVAFVILILIMQKYFITSEDRKQLKQIVHLPMHN